MKMWKATSEDGSHEEMVFECPGCGSGHSFCVKSSSPGHPVWTWNSSMEKPTFSPSLLVNGSDASMRCHLFLREGMLQFLGDCHHELKGQTVPLPEDDL